MAGIDVRLSQSQVQSQKQVQIQKMSQVQIMSLNLLAMSDMDLRSAIYTEVQKNPALEITSDEFASGVKDVRVNNRFADDTKYSSVSRAGQEKSDNFQNALESYTEYRVSLHEHLMEQCNASRLTPDQKRICTALIDNLNDKGFHTLSPHSLLIETDTPELLQECMDIVRHFDPVGTCCKSVEESLYVQALINGDAPECARFILNGHFDFLDPPLPQKILKKINLYIENQKTMTFADKDEITKAYSEDEIREALAYIKSLNPYPASGFGTDMAAFVSTDVIVRRVKLSGDNSEINDDIIQCDENTGFSVELIRGKLPLLSLSKQYESVAELDVKTGAGDEKSERLKAEHRFAIEAISAARIFMDCIRDRENTILRAAREIVRIQKLFFLNGPGFLKPLRQRDVASLIGVNDATVSRMANGKFIECEWGIFPVKYFFTNAVSTSSAENDRAYSQTISSNDTVSDDVINSKESLKHMVGEILNEHKDDKKPISDQKISDILAQKGIKLARRTVAKYRNELKINSSFGR